MSNIVKVILAIVVLSGIVAASLLIYTLPHWWFRVGTANATSSYGSSYQVPVYKSMKGDFLFVITQDSLRNGVIFDRETRRIGFPSISQTHVLPFVAYSSEAPVSVVWSDDKVKVEKDVNVVVNENRIEFNALDLRVKADINNF